MRVLLISHTPEAERLVAMAALRTRKREIGGAEDLSEELVERVLSVVISKGHLSVLEHASFTFLIEGISRVTSHQLVRHRIASYSQLSQRYVEISEKDFVIPPKIMKNEEARKEFERCVKLCYNSYQKLLKMGIDREDARYLIPQGVKTSIVVTMNARELLHFFSLRLCLRSQWEIRKMAEKMLKEVMKVAPKIFKHAGPRCRSLGYCPEGWKDCPLYPDKGQGSVRKGYNL